MLETDKPYPARSYRIKTPDGMAIIQIAHTPEDPANILHIEINIGKAGSSVAAWSNGFAKLLVLALEGHPLDTVIDTIVDISTDRMTYTDGIVCRSAIEGVAIAMQHYRRTYIVSPKIQKE